MTATVWGHELSLISGSGVFAAGPPRRRDRGAVPRDRGPAADGTLPRPRLRVRRDRAGARDARSRPRTVTAVDVNERALLLATDNAAALGLADRVRAVTAGRRSGRRAFDEIWSNPPIRIGKPALHDLLLTWLPAAGARTAAR